MQQALNSPMALNSHMAMNGQVYQTIRPHIEREPTEPRRTPPSRAVLLAFFVACALSVATLTGLVVFRSAEGQGQDLQRSNNERGFSAPLQVKDEYVDFTAPDYAGAQSGGFLPGGSSPETGSYSPPSPPPPATATDGVYHQYHQYGGTSYDTTVAPQGAYGLSGVQGGEIQSDGSGANYGGAAAAPAGGSGATMPMGYTDTRGNIHTFAPKAATTLMTTITWTTTTAMTTITWTTETTTTTTTRPATPAAFQAKPGQVVKTGPVEPGIDYPGNDLKVVPAVGSPNACAILCKAHSECLAWTWNHKCEKTCTEECHLKGNHPHREVARIRVDGTISSRLTRGDESLKTVERRKGQSLFCFSLMQPTGHEAKMLAWQYSAGASIFACDEYAVYSSTAMKVAEGLTAIAVNSDLRCNTGGDFKTASRFLTELKALNTDIFLAVWIRVVEGGRHHLHDWTVKVDADTVFFPDRLRPVVGQHLERETGVYLNNCQLGMLGSLEVLSRNAVTIWARGSPRCMMHFTDLCHGPCMWGEDMFLDQCLSKVLKVERPSHYGVLLDANCNPRADWHSCHNNTVAAFHPFKTLEEYQACVARAN